MIVSQKFREIVSSEQTKMKIALEIGVSFNTFSRWLLYKNEKFATLKNIAAIEKITGLKQEEMFEKEEANA